MSIIISTCGTSLLTNTKEDKLRKKITRHANIPIGKESDAGDDYKDIAARIDEVDRMIAVASIEEAKQMSAELNGILTYYEGQIERGKNDMHYLLSTDTWLGAVTAELVKTYLDSQGVKNAEVKKFSGLRTDDMFSFKSALSDIVMWCSEEIYPQRSEYDKLVFNLSGGFKSETGFFQALGMLYADETAYIFESGNELMRIPKLPLRLDAEEKVRKDAFAFRRAGLKLRVHGERNDIFWFCVDGEMALEPWGTLAFAQCKKDVYESGLLDSPSDKIRYEKSFVESCKGVQPDRIRMVNEKIDLLALFKESIKHPNLKSLHYHPLKNAGGEATHEIYAWSDAGAWRIYLKEEGDVSVLLKLDKHL